MVDTEMASYSNPGEVPRDKATIKQHRRAMFYWIKSHFHSDYSMLWVLNASMLSMLTSPLFFFTLTSWQGASPPGRGHAREGSLVILMFQVRKPHPIANTPPLPPSSSAMFVFAGAVLSKANCFTAPPGAPQEDFPPIFFFF